MYVNIGGGYVLRGEGIVAVFDMDNATWSRVTRAALARAEKLGEVVNAAEDLPRSFVLCEEGGKRMIYLSQLSSAAIARRSAAELR